MKQTRITSIIEVSLNVASGFILAMLVWIFIVPLWYPRMAGPVTESFWITLTFTVVSVVRGYFWRRLFNNGVQVTLSRWIHCVTGARFGKIGGD